MAPERDEQMCQLGPSANISLLHDTVSPHFRSLSSRPMTLATQSYFPHLCPPVLIPPYIPIATILPCIPCPTSSLPASRPNPAMHPDPTPSRPTAPSHPIPTHSPIATHPTHARPHPTLHPDPTPSHAPACGSATSRVDCWPASCPQAIQRWRPSALWTRSGAGDQVTAVGSAVWKARRGERRRAGCIAMSLKLKLRSTV